MPRKIFYFIFSLMMLPLPQVQAGQIVLPVPGTMVQVSAPYNPPILKGIKVNANNPFQLEFVLDQGTVETPFMASHTSLQDESKKLIKYFLAALTTPEKDLWVNLSPYEKDRIVPESFGQTEMGRDLLAQDYLLKQLTASLIYPEGDIGKVFWKRVYEETATKHGGRLLNVPISTFNKVWIVPSKAVVYENAKAGTAYVVESSLKVMLEEDYLAVEKNRSQPGDISRRDVLPSLMPSKEGLNVQASQGNPRAHSQTSQIIKDIVIPQLTKEINEGANFAQLRQVYHSLILAAWYKKKIRNSILSQVYADKNKTKGTEYNDSLNATRIYQQYLEAFKKGAYNYIKDEQNPISKQLVPRKYFSGGVEFRDFAMSTIKNVSQISTSGLAMVKVLIKPDAAMSHSLSREYYLIGDKENTAQPEITPNTKVHFSPDRVRIRPLLVQLASADSGKRNRTANVLLQEFNIDAGTYTEILIKNFIDPVGIEEAEKEFHSRPELKAGKKVFNEFEARRNARSASLFALMVRIKMLKYNVDTYNDARSIEALNKIKDVIVSQLLIEQTFWNPDIIDEDKLVEAETFLGHKSKNVPAKIAFLENLRLFAVANARVNDYSFRRDYMKWIMRSIETIISFEVKEDQVYEWGQVWEIITAKQNQAMQSEQKIKNITPGGIDFNPNLLDLNLAEGSNDFTFDVDAAMLQKMHNVAGFTPIVLDVQPLPLGAAGAQILQKFLGVHHD